MRGRIDLNEFIEENFEGISEEKELMDLSGKSLEGVMLEGDSIYLIPFYPKVDYFYHLGQLLEDDLKYSNLDNIKKGYFGKEEGYTYLGTDEQLKPSRPDYDVSLKVSFEKLRKPVYRDPESLLKKYDYEYGRAFMVKGPIPKEAIVGCRFSEHIRFIRGLRDGPVDFDEHFAMLRHFRLDFENELKKTECFFKN